MSHYSWLIVLLQVQGHFTYLKYRYNYLLELLIGSGRELPPHLISNLKLPHPQTTLSSSNVAGSTFGRAPGRSRPRAVGSTMLVCPLLRFARLNQVRLPSRVLGSAARALA